ncbi:Calcium/calmodulin-dependent protein kinase type 1B [Porphyridium purpureum]|uniref:Calcium/calmodulin-dependent protein kinase type 1B n=1 Tax=Porphyridium purpureum TaxID=35688 RepID=A0A5J4YVL5_PORPP|nr:Calcium/calmodulin-dependent protein kinase type 1B [Porphyridium purpureum]KAA8495315.1 Calcium/calmodulin-dependent protein kinase type 1B [Porphyridium purpureum]|eukprot:POR2579..scf210_14
MDAHHEAYQVLEAKASYNASALLRHGYARLTEGWVRKVGKRMGSKMRLLRLRGSVLSSRKDVDAKPSWELTVLDCVVEAGPKPSQLFVRMADRDLEFFATNESDRQRWVKAFREASTQRLEDFYKVGAQIGKGAFAQVFLCQSRDALEDETYVVKRIEKSASSNKHASLQISRELAIARSIRHPSIVTVIDIFESASEIMIIMEYAEFGDLFQILVERGAFTEAVAAECFASLFSALSYLHEKSIVHRDIKPANFLAARPESHRKRSSDRPDRKSEDFQAKLTDFGLSNVLTGASDEMMTTPVGTPYFLSPEMIIGRRYGVEVDLWAMGVSLFFFLSGQLPFAGANRTETYAKIAKAELSFGDPRWDLISSEAKGLISGLLEKDPALRYTVQDALSHEWLCDTGPRTKVDISSNLESGKYLSFDQRSGSKGKSKARAGPAVASSAHSAHGKANLEILQDVLDRWVLDAVQRLRSLEANDTDYGRDGQPDQPHKEP